MLKTRFIKIPYLSKFSEINNKRIMFILTVQGKLGFQCREDMTDLENVEMTLLQTNPELTLLRTDLELTLLRTDLELTLLRIDL